MLVPICARASLEGSTPSLLAIAILPDTPNYLQNLPDHLKGWKKVLCLDLLSREQIFWMPFFLSEIRCRLVMNSSVAYKGESCLSWGDKVNVEQMVFVDKKMVNKLEDKQEMVTEVDKVNMVKRANLYICLFSLLRRLVAHLARFTPYLQKISKIKIKVSLFIFRLAPGWLGWVELMEISWTQVLLKRKLAR